MNNQYLHNFIVGEFDDNDNNKRELYNKWVIFADYDFPLMRRFVNVHTPYDSFRNSSKIWQMKNEMSLTQF